MRKVLLYDTEDEKSFVIQHRGREKFCYTTQGMRKVLLYDTEDEKSFVIRHKGGEKFCYTTQRMRKSTCERELRPESLLHPSIPVLGISCLLIHLPHIISP